MTVLLVFVTDLTLRCAHDEYRSNRKARIHLSGDEHMPGYAIFSTAARSLWRNVTYIRSTHNNRIVIPVMQHLV